MKIFILLALMVSMAQAYECKLSGSLGNQDSLETSLNTETFERCKELAQGTKENKFFGLIDKDVVLLETAYRFKSEKMTLIDKVIFSKRE